MYSDAKVQLSFQGPEVLIVIDKYSVRLQFTFADISTLFCIYINAWCVETQLHKLSEGTFNILQMDKMLFYMHCSINKSV